MCIDLGNLAGKILEEKKEASDLGYWKGYEETPENSEVLNRRSETERLDRKRSRMHPFETVTGTEKPFLDENETDV